VSWFGRKRGGGGGVEHEVGVAINRMVSMAHEDKDKWLVAILNKDKPHQF